MNRRGFVTTGIAAGLAGLGGAGLGGAGLGGAGGILPGTRAGWWNPRGRGGNDEIRLSSNENPLGLSAAAREAVIEAITHANRYPVDFSAPLFPALASHLGVAEENLVLGAGSTEILQMAVQAFQGPGVPLIVAEPTFEDVPRYQRPLSFDLRTVPVTAELAHDVGRMREVAGESRRPAVVYVCNPNNPTGTVTPCGEIDSWIEEAPESTLFLMDEAYFEYADHPQYWSALKWIDRKPNVVVVRTFSKIYAMAGLRLGYAVAHPGTVARLRDFMMMNNPNVMAAAAGLASLRDEGLVARSLAVNVEAMEIATSTLDDLGLEWIPSHANFMMHRINGDLPAYITRMREAGIRVGRPFPPMLEWNRLSFGLPDEMDRWSEALRGFRSRGWI